MEELDNFREFLNAEVVTLDELNANMDQWTVGDVVELKKMVARTAEYIQRAERAQSRCLVLFEKNAGKVGGGSLLASYKKKGAAEMVQSLDIMFPDGEDSLLGDEYLKEGKVNEGLEKNNKVLVKLLKEYSEDYIVVYDKTLKKVVRKFIDNRDGYYSGRSKARRFVDDMVKSDGDIEKQNYEIGKETEYRSMEESVDEGPGQKHYTKDGKEWKGATHKMPDGTLMTQDPHNKDSEKLSHKSVNEDYMDSQVDQIAQAEFGMDFHQLGRGEKEWVRDEIDNMTFGEGDEPEKILTSRNKLEQTLNDISDELTDDQLDTISSMIVDLSSKIKKTLKK